MLNIGARCRVVSKSYRDVKGDVVVVERIVYGKIGATYHCRHEKTGTVLPFLERHLELIVATDEPVPQPEPEDEEAKALRNFFFPKKPERCGWCGQSGSPIANKFECNNPECRNYHGR